ncbi:Dabb family protein [Planctomonas psychrotolerans]|uniref:Dabb family protein n=1 Tax=Planctomonas psychrotolerans TaxID=2528712 RepID=UPI00123B6730|nr:Dabb family protein [Planctomonas psychrotolerans]
MTIRHVVSWKLTATDADTNREHRETITAALESLPALIPEIRSFTIGSNVVESDAAYDLVLIADYDDEAALDAYIVHPEHERVRGIIGPLVAARSVVDFVV